MTIENDSRTAQQDVGLQHASSERLPRASEEGISDTTPSTYLRGSQLVVALTGVLLSVLLTGLDQTVVANALPLISSNFNELANLTWVPTAFLITQVACLPFFGQLPVVFSTKWIFLIAIIIFEVGSLFSAVAPNFGFLIFGRAVQGVGAGGIFVASLIVVGEIAPLEDRPKYLGALGGVFAMGTVFGPLIGGGLVDKISWRWCFYINLPLSAPTFIAAILFLRMPTNNAQNTGNHPAAHQRPSIASRLLSLDLVGFVLLLGFTTCLVLGLQWGGNTKPWGSVDVIVTLVLSGVLIALFIAWQHRKGPTSIVPLILLRGRSMLGCCLVGLWSRMAFFSAIYFLPLYFQAVHNRSAVQSGIDLLPLSLALIISAGVTGDIISRIGRYWHVMFFGPWIELTAFALLFTLDEHSSPGKYIGFQIMAGVGVGTTIQIVVLAAQANVAEEHQGQASALITFIQWLGGIIGLAVAGTVFQNKLASGLREFAPSAPFDELRQSVTALSALSGSEHDGAVHAYVKALQLVFIAVAVPASALCSISSLLVKNISLKAEKVADLGDAANAERALKNSEK